MAPGWGLVAEDELEMLELPTLEEIQAAADLIKDVAVRTPLVPLHSYGAKQDIFLKPEILQPITSFKLRGMFNAVAAMSGEERRKGLSTISSGNTAQALGWVARYFGVKARSVMPDRVPASKIETVKSYGTEPIIVTEEELREYIFGRGWEREPYSFIHPWHDHAFTAGTGTRGLEIIADLPEVDTVYLPVGGGGLATGLGGALKALKPSVRVVGVEPEAVPAAYESLRAGKGVTVEPGETVCDGVAVPFITDEMVPLLRRVLDDVVLVSEKEIKKAMRRLMLRNKMIVEGAGALSVAAATDQNQDKRGKAVCLLTGGSIDTEKLLKILNDPSLK